MIRGTTFVTIALIATFALAGCGEDNGGDNDNCNGGTSTSTPITTPKATSTVAPPTATPTSTGGVPAPTATATPGGGSACEGAALTATITSLPGSDLDTGWTGIAHDQTATEAAQVEVNLDCGLSTDLCVVDGSALVGQPFGSPLPLSSGGVPVCVLNSFREAITGTYNCANGTSQGAVKLLAKVFLVQDIAKPCPLCNGDPTPNDGVKGGTCDGGTAPGAPCDVGGISTTFGPTSNDCLPTGTSVGDLTIDLDPFTTGTVSVDASMDCLSPLYPKGTCYCAKQVQPNACTSGVCPASKLCEDGPIDGLCSNQRYRSCRTGTGTADCENVYPGSGTCVESPRPCFGTNITRVGVPGKTEATLAAVFCVPATKAPAINTTGGLPGPGSLSLTSKTVRVPR